MFPGAGSWLALLEDRSEGRFDICDDDLGRIANGVRPPVRREHNPLDRRRPK